jgi:LacI family transcriptional regulator
MSERVTLKHVAAELALSLNTVSRALAGKEAVSPETRKLIRETATRMGYVPNTMARSLVLGRAMTMGLVITNPSNPFYASLISAIESRCRDNGYSLLLLATEENPDNELQAIEQLRRWGVDAAMAVPVQRDADGWRQLAESHIPLILINRDLEGLDCDFVGIDYERGAYEAASYLAARTSGSLYLLEEDLDISTVNARIAGFTTAVKEHNHSSARVVRVPTRRRESDTLPWRPEEAHRVTRALIPELVPGSSLMVGNDFFALGVYRALAEVGLRVPADVSVLGFGDHPFAAYMQPALTSVSLPAARIGTDAVDILLERLTAPDEVRAPKKQFLEANLIVRDSTRLLSADPLMQGA